MSASELVETSSEPSAAANVLDTRGLLCPYPFIRAKETLEAAAPGTVLEILTDSEPTAVSSIPVLCEQNGYRYTVAREGDNWRLLVTKP